MRGLRSEPAKKSKAWRAKAPRAQLPGRLGEKLSKPARDLGHGSRRRRPPKNTVITGRTHGTRRHAIIDGGNSYYKDDVRRAAMLLREKGIHYLDVGTSGGVWGVERGYCMMIGGTKASYDRLDPIFTTLAPGMGDVGRTPGRRRPSKAPLRTATSTADLPAPGISSRWFTTASNTA